MPRGNNKTRIQQDTAWKDILDHYFKDFVDFCLPQVSGRIDWNTPWENLDKELQAIHKDYLAGHRLVDKLVKVFLKDGEEQWLLFHLEVQGTPEANFPHRMLVYYYRIYDKYQRSILSCAILTDARKDWRPSFYETGVAGSRLRLDYLVVKLLDYEPQRESLEASANPFATIILCQLEALQARKKSIQERLSIKFALTCRLYQKGYSRKQIYDFYRFIDYLICLPDELEIEFEKEVCQWEEDKHMPYVSTIERRGMEKGFEQGILQGIQQGIEQGIQKGIQKGMREGEHTLFMRLLKKKFARIPMVYLDKLNHATEQRLLEWGERLLNAQTVEEIFTDSEE